MVFSAAATAYCVLWMAHVRQPHPRPGFSDYDYSPNACSMTVGVVFPQTPAEKAGLRPGDRIIAIDGRKLENLLPLYESIIVGQKDVIELTLQDLSSPGGV